ncbi:MAG: hypothetical protein H6681_00345 [Desulfobacteraceae bacterium]|nr:hypothetical protein [Desulfobacteraceae bacterium]
MKAKTVFLTIILFFSLNIFSGLFYAQEEEAPPAEETVPEESAKEDPQAIQDQELMRAVSYYETMKKELEEKEKRLNEKEEKLNQLEQELELKLENLKKLDEKVKDAIANLNKEKDLHERRILEAEEQKYKDLSKVYENMKAKKAAQIVNNMDIEVAKKMFSYMRPQVAAEILANTNPEKAALISSALTKREELVKK